ncbi:MAG: TonB-dependent receptor [Puniceicoccales bacterium]|jgi:hemoglobin/transferrin/lactoferrin receptor protein|nr:TonB-dependent receptor [Puniceicoccales bacterium]
MLTLKSKLLLSAAALTLSFAAATMAIAQESAEKTAAPETKPPAPPKASTPAEEKKADLTVVVVATRIAESPYKIAGSTEAVTLDEARAAGAVTLGDTFKYVPGVVVPFSGGASTGAIPYTTGGEKSINVRGLEDNRVAIVTDGIRQPDDFTAGTGSGFASPGRIFFDPATYSQIEIFKSAASSVYGSGALSGAISASSIGPEQLLGNSLSGNVLSNTVSYASANESINNVVQAAIGNGDWATSAVYSFRDGSELRNKGARKYSPVDFTSHAVIGKIVRKFESVRLEGTVDYYRLAEDVLATNAAGEMSMGPTMKYEYLTPRQDTIRDRLRASIGAEISPAGGAVVFDTLHLLGYWQDSTSRTVNPQTTRITRGTTVTYRNRTNILDYDTEIGGFNATARKNLESSWIAQTIQYGFETSYSDIASKFTRIEDNVRQNDPTAMAPSEVFRFGMFASDKISIGKDKAFVVTPSIRVDYYDVSPSNTAYYVEFAGARAAKFENWSVSPGISTLYNITADINVYGLFNVGTRNPSADELNGCFTHSGGGMTGGQFRTVPNPDLKDETSRNFEIGIQGNTSHHAFHLAGFYNTYDNFIETMYDTGKVDADGYIMRTARNLDDVTIYGAEARWDWRVDKYITGGIDGFQTGLAFAWTKGRQDSHVPLASVDPWKFITYIGYTSPSDKWGVRLTATFVAKKAARDIGPEATGDSTAPVGSYFLLDISAFYRFNEHWTINAGLNNLTDREYVTWASARASGGGMGVGRYTQPGINGFVSVTAKF